MPDLSKRVRLGGPALLLIAVVASCSATAPAAEDGVEATDAPASASVEQASPSASPSARPSPSPSPSSAPEEVLLTYEGQWTLTAYAFDGGEPEYQVGDTRPGTVEVRCGGMMADSGYCGATLSWDGQPFSETSVEIIGDGQLLMVLEDELANCADGQVRSTTIEIYYAEAAAEATYERLTEPRTCDDGSGTLYFTDDAWSFEGTSGD